MSLLLLVHITGGIFTGIVIFGSAIALLWKKEKQYNLDVKSLSILASFEIISGVLLAYISPRITAQSLCTNIALYLGVIALTYAGFVYRTKPSLQNILQTISPTIASLSILAPALVENI